MEEEKKNEIPQEEEEEKKKKGGFVPWWKGLTKGAKVGLCVGAALLVSTAVAVPIIVTSNKGGKVTDGIPFEIQEMSSKEYINLDDYPKTVAKNATEFTYKIKPFETENVLCSLLDQKQEQIAGSSYSFSPSESSQSHTVTGLNFTNVTKIYLYCFKGA